MQRLKTLDRMKSIREEIERCSDALLRTRSLAEKVTQSFSPSPGGGKKKDRSDLYVRLVELEQRILDRQVRLEEVREGVERYLTELSSLEARLVRMRFCDGLSARAVQMRLHISQSTYYRALKAAVAELSELGME